eukprot:1175993-Prorocentrum_minimum.AAC.1
MRLDNHNDCWCGRNAVYEGLKSYYKEDDEASPVNAYGMTKLDAETAVRANWKNHGKPKTLKPRRPEGRDGIHTVE